MNDEDHAWSRDRKDNIGAEGTAQQASLSSGAGVSLCDGTTSRGDGCEGNPDFRIGKSSSGLL